MFSATRTAAVTLAALGLTASSAAADGYIVQVKEGHDPRGLADNVHAKPKHFYDSVFAGFAAELNDGQLRALRNNPKVERIEADTPFSIQATQSNATWGLDRIDQRHLPLNSTYVSNRTANNVRVYVLDTGVNSAHSEFEGRASSAFNATSASSADCNGHGTHVAGTIGSKTWGVAKKAMIRSVKVLNECDGDGTASDIIEGLDWVKANAIKPAVVNLSVGGGDNFFVDLAADGVADQGIFVVAAAGNNAYDSCQTSPAGASKVMTVAASQSNDARWTLSNWGTCVELYAPGVSIRSLGLTTNGPTATMTGTSMASPHVAGVAALHKHFGDLTNDVVRSAIMSDATVGKVSGNINQTPNRLLFKGTL